MKYFVIFLLAIYLFSAEVRAEEERIPLRTAIQISSDISDGKFPMEWFAKSASAMGIDAIIFTDRDVMKWEYGLWPLRQVVKKTIENKSVFTYGIKKYLARIKKLEKDFPGIIFIPGVESAPFYYWKGSPFTGNLTIHDWHKHILAIGLDEPEDYRGLPVVGNRRGLRKGFNPLRLWPFFTLALGLAYLLRIFRHKNEYGEIFFLLFKSRLIIVSAFIFLSIVFILNNQPFCDFRFDQYQSGLGIAPYQNFIDYVGNKGGLTYWAHPEAEYITKIGSVRIETRKHIDALSAAGDYTGFCVFWEGYEQVGHPGGLWDELLLEYCRGIRSNPVWAIGGLAFDDLYTKTEDISWLRRLQTVILAKDRSKSSLMEALRNGQNYVVTGDETPNCSLDEFYASDVAGTIKGFMGDAIKVQGDVVLDIEGKFPLKQPGLELTIIKNGKIIKTEAISQGLSFVYVDQDIVSGKSYYRVEIKGKGVHLVSNPIFVERT